MTHAKTCSTDKARAKYITSHLLYSSREHSWEDPLGQELVRCPQIGSPLLWSELLPVWLADPWNWTCPVRHDPLQKNIQNRKSGNVWNIITMKESLVLLSRTRVYTFDSWTVVGVLISKWKNLPTGTRSVHSRLLYSASKVFVRGFVQGWTEWGGRCK